MNYVWNSHEQRTSQKPGGFTAGNCSPPSTGLPGHYRHSWEAALMFEIDCWYYGYLWSIDIYRCYMMLQDILLSSTHMLEWAIPGSYSYLFPDSIEDRFLCVFSQEIKKTRPVKTREVSVVCFLYQWPFFFRTIFLQRPKRWFASKPQKMFPKRQNVFGSHEVS